MVVTDYFADVSFNCATTRPDRRQPTADAGIVWAGVFTDKNGKIRPLTGGWTVGAIEV